jgi:hypothetical protein
LVGGEALAAVIGIELWLLSADWHPPTSKPAAARSKATAPLPARRQYQFATRLVFVVIDVFISFSFSFWLCEFYLCYAPTLVNAHAAPLSDLRSRLNKPTRF